MRQEFFGVDEAEAVKKATTKLRLPEEALRYQVLPEIFGQPMRGAKVGIIVDYDDSKVGSGKAAEGPLGFDENLAGLTDPLRRAEHLVDGIFKRMGFQTRTRAVSKGEHVVLSVELVDGKLDLRRGDSRELRGAMQFLINRMMSGNASEEPRLVIDIGGKLEERTEQMRAVAKDLAGKIAVLQKPIHILLMDSQDRRLVHTELLEHPGVGTTSQGEDRFRVLSVAPKNTPEGKA